jgi:hypothetical protein
MCRRGRLDGLAAVLAVYSWQIGYRFHVQDASGNTYRVKLIKILNPRGCGSGISGIS